MESEGGEHEPALKLEDLLRFGHVGAYGDVIVLMTAPVEQLPDVEQSLDFEVGTGTDQR